MSDCFDHGSDALDKNLAGEEEDCPFGGDYPPLVCKFCGEDDLEWQKLPSGKYWLHEFDEATNDWTKPHKCKKRENI